ncbi:MAG: DUF1405 domain-containing protein [Candidatus Hodarchaeales archaeon]|jgi:uncharacterized membrane protein YpjA
MALDRLSKERLLQILSNPIILVSAIILNLIWGIFGVLAYLPQTDGVSFLLWLFVPDCPLYSLMFAIFLIDRERMKSHQIYMWILTFGLIKFSLAAPVIYFLKPNHYHAIPIFGINLPNIYPFDYFHLSMLFQGLFVAAFFLERSWYHFSIAFLWLLLNDFIDFVFLTFPFYYPSYKIMQTFTVFYIFINLAIVIIGSFFVLGGLEYVKTILGIDEKRIYEVPILSSAIIEKNDD